MRILFLEDHRVFAQLVIAQFLGDAEVTHVESIAAAHESLANGVFDVILVDFDLPDGKGDSFVRTVRESANPILIVAVSAHEHGNAALLAAGADSVCPKASFRDISKHLHRADSG